MQCFFATTRGGLTDTCFGVAPGDNCLLTARVRVQKGTTSCNISGHPGRRGLHETEAGCHSVVAGNTVAGFLYCADQLPVASSRHSTCHRVQQDSAGSPGGAGKSRYYCGARQKCPPWAADRYLCAQWAVVGAALARSPSNSNSSRFNLEHRNSSGI